MIIVRLVLGVVISLDSQHSLLMPNLYNKQLHWHAELAYIQHSCYVTPLIPCLGQSSQRPPQISL